MSKKGGSKSVVHSCLRPFLNEIFLTDLSLKYDLADAQNPKFITYSFSIVKPRFSIATLFATLRITLSMFPSFSPSVAAFDNLK